MKKLLVGALLATLLFGPAHALDQALVVSACGTPPTTYTAGQQRLPTVDTTGKLCLAGGGGGGSPGGSNGQIQWNNAGSFGGVTGATTSGTSLTLVAPNLGTPSLLIGTNITGTAAGLTAGNVTTNANLTGDVTSVGNATTLVTAQPGAHTWAAAQTFTLAPVFTDASGSRTALGLGALATVTPGTGVATALGVNIGSAGAPVLFNGAGGTPSSLVGTNITGTASGLTAGNVSTNANLTGPITSVGNATSIASQTGTGTTFVVSAAPTITGAMAASGTLAIGGATIGTDALAWTGTATGSGQLNAASFVPTSATIPALGMYTSGTNTLDFATSGVNRLRLSTTLLNTTIQITNNNAAGFSLNTGAASSTAPTFSPNKADTTTGIGAQASSSLSLISAATERVRVATGAASVSDMLFPGTLFTGGTATTTFPQILVQPTGTTAATSWSTSGTVFGANVVSGFAGNFLDFHAAGAASVFSVNSSGTITSTSGANIGSSSAFAWTGRGILSSSGSGVVQLGNADAASPVAQTLRSQNVVTGTSNTAGANFTVIPSISTGSGASGNFIVQAGGTGAAATTQNTPTNALVINGNTGALSLPKFYTTAGYIQTDASGNITSTANPVIASKLITSTRDLTAATGTQALTGMGFTPSACDVVAAVVGGAYSYTTFSGHSDSTKNAYAVTFAGPGTTFLNVFIGAADGTVGSSFQVATIQSYDADGLTLSWTKTSTPTGTLSFAIRCFK